MALMAISFGKLGRTDPAAQDQDVRVEQTLLVSVTAHRGLEASGRAWLFIGAEGVDADVCRVARHSNELGPCDEASASTQRDQFTDLVAVTSNSERPSTLECIHDLFDLLRRSRCVISGCADMAPILTEWWHRVLHGPVVWPLCRSGRHVPPSFTSRGSAIRQCVVSARLGSSRRRGQGRTTRAGSPRRTACARRCPGRRACR
jgi:hypothetical protein